MDESSTDRAAIGRRREALRREAGLTQEALAELAGLSHKTVCNAEDGTPLREESLARLASALGVSIGEYAHPASRFASQAPAGQPS